MPRLTRRDLMPLWCALLGTLLVFVLGMSASSVASDRVFQTVPTPTPRTVPTPGQQPAPGPARDDEPVPVNPDLRLSVSPQDVHAGDEILYTLWFSNTSESPVGNVVLTIPLDAQLHPIDILAAQGTAKVEGSTALVHLGTIEPKRTAQVVLRARISDQAQAGHVILSQSTAHFDGGTAISNVAAAGLPPDHLPATGRDGRQP